MPVVETSAPTAKDAPEELRALTGLRGLAAVVVVLGHVEVFRYGALLGRLRPLVTWHNAAVDVFFVLSGFTLAHVYLGRGAPPSMRAFASARVARIAPLYYVVLLAAAYRIATLAGSIPGYTAHAFRHELLEQLLLVSAWPVLGDGTFFVHPAWSISVEVFCYLAVFPLLARLAPRPRVSARRVALFSLLALAASAALYRLHFDVRLTAPGAVEVRSALAYGVNLLRGVLGFGAGYLLYTSYRERDAFFRAATELPDLGLVALVLVCLAVPLGLADNQLLVVLAPFLCLACAGGAGVTGRVLGGRVAHHLGEISYSLYLLHVPVLELVRGDRGWISGKTPGDAALLLGVIYLASLASYRLVERPARSLVRRALGGSGAAARGPRVVVATALVAYAALAWHVAHLHSLPSVATPMPERPTGASFGGGVSLGSGWHGPEEWGAWAAEQRPTLLVEGPSPGTLVLRVEGCFSGYLVALHLPSCKVSVRRGATVVETIEFRPGDGPHELRLRGPFPAGGTTLVLEGDAAPRSPAELGVGEDSRPLGIGIQRSVAWAPPD